MLPRTGQAILPHRFFLVIRFKYYSSMNAAVLFYGFSVDRSGNFVTQVFIVLWFKYFSSISALVLFSGVSVDRSGNFVTRFVGIFV